MRTVMILPQQKTNTKTKQTKKKRLTARRGEHSAPTPGSIQNGCDNGCGGGEGVSGTPPVAIDSPSYTNTIRRIWNFVVQIHKGWINLGFTTIKN